MFVAEIEHFVERAGLASDRPAQVVGSHVANLVSKERVERQFAALGIRIYGSFPRLMLAV